MKLIFRAVTDSRERLAVRLISRFVAARLVACVSVAISVGAPNLVKAADGIVQDAEYYVLEAQNGEKWAKEDIGLDKKLAELRKKHGRPPNLIHVMWDDTAYGDVGIPAIQKVRGLDTPNLNQLAAEGI
ncbi:MAG: hypothetical protein QNL90_03560, partial [Gammaproteobacteria bacterium]|nr:hypothetical protein [Gammaproteobacteria bacterium]MDX2459177.1 hypothetical protein [Gammaproteobacteria bacterium]